MSAYLARDATSRSEVKDAYDGPRSWALGKKRADDSTKSTGFGNIVHSLVCDPDEFPLRYILEPSLDNRLTKAGKEAASPRSTESYKDDVQRLLSVHPNGQIITLDDYEKAKACRDALKCHPEANRLLFTKRIEAEVTITFEYQGVKFKIRPDVVAEDHDGMLAVVDLKTCNDVSPQAFKRAVTKYGYDFSPWLYTRGCEQEFGTPCTFYWPTIQTDGTQHVRVYRASPDMMRLSSQKFDQGFANMMEYRADPETSERAHDHQEIEDLGVDPWDNVNPEITFGSASAD